MGITFYPPRSGLFLLKPRQILSAPATTITFSGLSPSDGERYAVLIEGVGGAGIAASGDILMQPNGVAGTNQLCQDVQGGANFNLGNLHAGSFSLAGVHFHLWAEIDVSASATSAHGFRAHGSFTSTGGTLLQELQAGRWADTAAITKIDMVAATANAFGTGTRASLYVYR